MLFNNQYHVSALTIGNFNISSGKYFCLPEEDHVHLLFGIENSHSLLQGCDSPRTLLDAL